MTRGVAAAGSAGAEAVAVEGHGERPGGRTADIEAEHDGAGHRRPPP
ncbi:hypothetical protein [Micromonospora craniellae]|nr:hypothetical protein [Micromonospora craniellae]